VKTPTSVNVPEILQVTSSNSNPVGNVPSIVQVSGALPIAVSVAEYAASILPPASAIVVITGTSLSNSGPISIVAP